MYIIFQSDTREKFYEYVKYILPKVFLHSNLMLHSFDLRVTVPSTFFKLVDQESVYAFITSTREKYDILTNGFNILKR